MNESEIKTAVEYCSHCDAEVELIWDVADMGYKAFCPVCGNLLMLCDECLHDCDGTCDYDRETDSCRFTPAKFRFNALDIRYARDRLELTDGPEGTLRLLEIIKNFDRGLGDIYDVIDAYENDLGY